MNIKVKEISQLKMNFNYIFAFSKCKKGISSKGKRENFGKAVNYEIQFFFHAQLFTMKPYIDGDV